jgi:esterase/lipase
MLIKQLDFPIPDSSKPFADYIHQCSAFIEKRRGDLGCEPLQAKGIVEANAPFEFFPGNSAFSGKRLKQGALLIHGLLDSPFSLRDIGLHLQSQGIYNRSILLPGHGTVPSDLLHVSHLDWKEAVRAGIASLREVVDQVYLIGYSTGAALSILEAFRDPDIAGILLLSPAVKIKPPVSYITWCRPLLKWLSKNQQWVWQETEVDYVKYLSVAVNAVQQVTFLTDDIAKLTQQQQLPCPIFMSISREDETVCSQHAIHFFSNMSHEASQLLLYSMSDGKFSDPRIQLRLTRDISTRVKNFSHTSLPFSPTNPHYGQSGDYARASDFEQQHVIYGAFNRAQVDVLNYLYTFGLVKNERRELTFNPDFDYLMKKIIGFMTI